MQDNGINLLLEIEEDDCTHIHICPNSEGQIYCLASLVLLRVQKLGALVLDLLLECSHYWLFPFLNDKWRHVIHLAYEDPWGFW